jgi:hypothetical protein
LESNPERFVSEHHPHLRAVSPFADELAVLGELRSRSPQNQNLSTPLLWSGVSPAHRLAEFRLDSRLAKSMLAFRPQSR